MDVVVFRQLNRNRGESVTINLRRVGGIFVAFMTALSFICASAVYAQTPYRIIRTGGQGVFLRLDGPSFSSRKAPGPNDGQTDFTVICQMSGDNYSGSTIWDLIEYRGNRGYINDYFMYTGKDGWDGRLPRCGADQYAVSNVFAAARDRSGLSKVGRPKNAVHRCTIFECRPEIHTPDYVLTKRLLCLVSTLCLRVGDEKTCT